MNNVVHKQLLTVVLLSILVLVTGLGCSSSEYLVPAVPLKPPVQAEWPTIEHSTIDIADVVHTLKGKPQKEFDDQLRDWAVYGRLTQLKLDEDTFAKATFRAPPLRLAYLHEAFMFDYGRGRRAIVGDKDVLLFYDRSDPDRVKTLGQLADRVRMEIGEIPEEFQIFEIVSDVTNVTIHLNRKASIPGSEMFSPKYGYMERSISGLEDFKGWLESIDDVTYAATRDGQLQLGGRRSLMNRTSSVTVEDVAVLVQAQRALEGEQGHREQEIDQAKAEIEAHYAALIAEIDRDSVYERYREKVNHDREMDLQRLEQFRQFKPSPGFSLDPQWNPKGLQETLYGLAAEPRSVVEGALSIAKAGFSQTPTDATPYRLWQAAELVMSVVDTGNPRQAVETIRRVYGAKFQQMAVDVRDALQQTDVKQRSRQLDMAMQPLWMMMKAPPPGGEEITHAVVEYIRASHQIQCARYDGPLQGTRVGMTLFYADLLAKLWESVDYHHSAPSLAVSGFLSGPRMNLPEGWAEELARTPATRLWFGPKGSSYTKSADGETLWFEHIATRVFSAGSDPANPGVETQPREDSRRSIGWWDRHYRDIADYEPQYHVQNQIMKWSILTGWKHEVFSFLEQVKAKRDYRFDTWYNSHKKNLRYQHPINLRPKSDWVTGTECIDLLASYPFESAGGLKQISGGVSLGGSRSLDVAPKISLNVDRSLRHAVQETIEGAGTAIRVVPRYEGNGRTLVELRPETRTRTATKDLHIQRFDVTYDRTADANIRVTVGSDRVDIGSLHGSMPRDNAVKLGFSHTSQQIKPADGTVDAPKVLKEANEALAKGDGPAAARLYDMAAQEVKALPPEVAAKQGIAQILSGRSAEGIKTLGDPAKVPDTVLRDPALVKQSRLDGLRAAIQELKTNDTGSTLLDVPVKNMRIVADGIEVRSRVKLDVPLQVESMSVAERIKAMEDPDTVFYAPKGAFGNRHDFEVNSNGFYGATARTPNISFKQVKASGSRYAPDEVVTQEGTVYEKLPSVAINGSIRTKTHAKRMVIIHLPKRCDSNNDGSVSDEERRACGIR